MVKGCHLGGGAGSSQGAEGRTSAATQELGDTSAHLCGCADGAASGGGAVGSSLGQGDLGNVVPTLNQDLHKAQEVWVSQILFLIQEAAGEQTSVPTPT